MVNLSVVSTATYIANYVNVVWVHGQTVYVKPRTFQAGRTVVPVIILSFLLKCLQRCLRKEDRQPSGKPTRVNQTVSTIDGTIVLAIILFNILVSLLYVELPLS